MARCAIRDEQERVTELCRRLSVTDDEENDDDDELLSDSVDFGCGFKLTGQPYITFYQFDMTPLLERV